MLWTTTFTSGALLFAASAASRTLKHRVYTRDDAEIDPLINEDYFNGFHTNTFESDHLFNSYAQKRSCEQQCSSLISRCIEIERSVFVCEMDSSLLLVIIALGVLTGILVPTFFISLYICGFYSYISQIMNGSYKCDAETESLQGKPMRKESDTNVSTHIEINEETTETKISPQSTVSAMEKTRMQNLNVTLDAHQKNNILSKCRNSVELHETDQQAVDIL